MEETAGGHIVQSSAQSTSYVKLYHLAQDLVWLSFENLEGWSFHSISGQLVLVLNHCHNENFFLHIISEFHIATYIQYLCSFFFSEYLWVESGCLFHICLGNWKQQLDTFFAALKMSKSSSLSLFLYVMFNKSWQLCWTCSSFSGFIWCFRAPDWTMNCSWVLVLNRGE